MTHASAAGSPLAVDPALVRLSVGIETVADLLADLDEPSRVALAAPGPRPHQDAVGASRVRESIR